MFRFIPASELERVLEISSPSIAWVAFQGGDGQTVGTPEVIGEWNRRGIKHSDSALKGPLGLQPRDKTVGTPVGKLLVLGDSWDG